jgi:AcrR family transcriptional regulator
MKTQVRQEQIIRAAMEIVAAKGISGLSITGVSDRVGLVPSAIYRHFASKDELIDAVVGFIEKGLGENVTASSRNGLHALERLEAILKRHVRFIRKNHAVPRIVFSEEVYSGSPERRRRLYGIIQVYLDELAKVVRRGQERGEINSNIPAATVALMFLGLIQPAAILWHISDGKFNVTKNVEKSWDAFRQLIAGR